MFCENCGNKIPDGSAFCEECGTKIETGTPVSTQNNTPPKQPISNYNSNQIEDQSYSPKKKKPVALIIVIIIIIGVGGFFGIKMLNEKDDFKFGTNVSPSVSDNATSEAQPKESKQSYKDYKGYEDGKDASIGDFFWFTEDVKWDGLPESMTVIKDFNEISGYWKAYTETIPMFLDEEEYKEWFNAEISGSENKATFTFHTKGFTGFDAQTGGSYDISMKDGEKYSGGFSNGELIFGDINSKGIQITIMQFYSLNGKQYALGEIEYISNEKQNIVLVRP